MDQVETPLDDAGLNGLRALGRKQRDEERDLLTAEDAQVYLGVSRATFWNLVRRYRLPRYKIPVKGKRVFFNRSDLDRLREPVRIDGAPQT